MAIPPGSLQAREFSGEFSAHVVKVADGDSLTILSPELGLARVRLRAIDAPELAQPYGRIARRILEAKVGGEEVRLDVRERDRYDRLLADVYLGDRLINQEMIAEGYAWHYNRFHQSRAFDRLEAEAQEQRTGLWKGRRPMRPSRWRRLHPRGD